jgi:hypothetical protein
MAMDSELDLRMLWRHFGEGFQAKYFVPASVPNKKSHSVSDLSK